jgi:phosphoglycolate phosphatase-like HAD superfamily hydrolase
VKLAVFDIDGTLTLGDGLGTSCFFSMLERVFGEAGVDRRLESYAESTDGAIAREAALRALGRHAAADDLARFKDLYLEELGARIRAAARAYRPVPGADGVLAELAARGGWRVALATGNWRRAAELKLDSAGIEAPRVGAFSEDGDSRRDVLSAAIAAAQAVENAAFDAVVYVGDQPWDLGAARALGVGFVGIEAEGRARRLEAEGVRVAANYRDARRFFDLLEEASLEWSGPAGSARPLTRPSRPGS